MKKKGKQPVTIKWRCLSIDAALKAEIERYSVDMTQFKAACCLAENAKKWLQKPEKKWQKRLVGAENVSGWVPPPLYATVLLSPHSPASPSASPPRSLPLPRLSVSDLSTDAEQATAASFLLVQQKASGIAATFWNRLADQLIYSECTRRSWHEGIEQHLCTL